MGGWRDATRQRLVLALTSGPRAHKPSGLSSNPCPFQSTSIFRVHVNREAVLRAACALPNVFIFIFITYMYVPSSYCCRRVINVQRVTCVANDKHKLSCQNTWSKKVQWPL